MKSKQKSILEHTFSNEEILLLIEYRDNQEDYRLKQRFIVFLLVIDGVPIDTICKTFKLSPKSIDNWFRKYISEGIESLNSFNYKKKGRISTVTKSHD